MLRRDKENCCSENKISTMLFTGVVAICSFVVAAAFVGSKDIRKSKKYPELLKKSYDGLSPEEY